MVMVQAPQFIDLLKNIIPFFQAPTKARGVTITNYVQPKGP
jgi:hypothetical protein